MLLSALFLLGDIKTQLLRDHGILKAGASLISPFLKSYVTFCCSQGGAEFVIQYVSSNVRQKANLSREIFYSRNSSICEFEIIQTKSSKLVFHGQNLKI